MPETIVHYEDGRSGGEAVFGGDCTAKKRRDAEVVEGIGRYDRAEGEETDGFAVVVGGAHAAVGDEIPEYVILVAKGSDFRKGEIGANSFTARACEVVDAKDNRAVEISVRKRVEEDTVDDAEDDRRSANPEGESKDGDESETGVFAKIAERVAEVSEEIVEVSFPVGVADFVFDAVETAKMEACAPASFFWADPCCDVIGDLLFEMEAKFLIEFVLGARFLEEAANAANH